MLASRPVELRAQPFPCQVVRHRGARRMTLRVAPAGIRVTVPPRTPAREIDAFLRASAGWVQEQSARLAPAPAPLRSGDRLALLDDALVLEVREGGRAGAVRRGDRLAVTTSPGGGAEGPVEAWYRREARALITPRVHAVAGGLGVTARRVAIRDPRSRWGSASGTGTLSFSWRLALAPERVLDYVVAHEVCHLRRPDHSPAFWALVAEVFPAHAEARAWLRSEGALLHRGPAWRTDRGLSPV